MLKNISANIYANGESEPNIKLDSKGFNIVLDGFANTLVNSDVVPDLIIGDFDSIDNNIRKELEHKGVKTQEEECQNTTDLEKSLRFCMKNNFQDICIYNALGGRMDHIIHNLGLLKKYNEEFSTIKLINGDEIIFFIRDAKVSFKGKIASRLSLMPFSSAVVSTVGLKYDMKEVHLVQGEKESACNFLSHENGSIKVLGSSLMIVDKSIDYKIFK